jgi:hypothetical protein
MMAATAILAELRFLVAHGFLGTFANCFCHGECLCGKKK